MPARRHGQSETKLYRVWKAMRRRCDAAYDKAFHNYGGRGIRVCAVWLDFVAFYEWAHASGYAEGLTLERRDVDGDYTPQNCCWIPKAQQSRNTRRYQRIEYAGRALLLCEWAEELGISYYALRHRLNRGWSVERAFTTPVQERKVA